MLKDNIDRQLVATYCYYFLRCSTFHGCCNFHPSRASKW